MPRDRIHPAIDKRGSRLKQEQPIGFRSAHALRRTAARKPDTTGFFRNAMRMIRGTEIANDHFADHSLDRAIDERSQRARQILLVIPSLDHYGKHTRQITESTH